MKYNININQYAAVQADLGLDLIDLAIFDFIKDFAHSSKCAKLNTSDGIFFWVSHELIIEELPLLGIKTRQGINKRINNLIDAKLLVRHEGNRATGRTFYTFGENYDRLVFAHSEAAEPSPEPTTEQEFEGVNNRLHGATPVARCKQTFTGGVNNRLHGGVNKRLHYNNNKDDNNNKDNIDIVVCEKERKALFRNSPLAELVTFYKDGRVDETQLRNKFAGIEYNDIDLVYYWQVVSDWSDQKNCKRTEKGWYATIRQFIRSDKADGRLHTLSKSMKIDVQEAINYLNNDY